MATLADIRAQANGAYDDMSDEELARRVHQKFYADMEFGDFAGRVGLEPQPTQPSREIPQRQDFVRETPDRGFFGNIGNWATGARDQRTTDREAAWQSIPEQEDVHWQGGPLSGALNALPREARTWLDAQGRANAVGLGFFLNRDEQERARIIRRQVPGSEFRRDEFGNLQVRYRNDQPWAYINAPGASVQDAQGIANDVVRFAPAARAGSALTTVGGRIAAAGAASAATEAASEAASIPLGAEGVNAGNVAISGIGGAGGQALSDVVGAGVQAVPQVIRRFAPARPGPVETIEAGRVDLPGAAKRVGQAVDEARARDASNASRATQRGNEAAYSDADEFGVPLTRGQATGDARQIAIENRMARGGSGEQAEKTLRGFEQRQNDALREGGMRIATRGADPISNSTGEAGAAFRDSIAARAARAEEAVDAAFDEAFTKARAAPVPTYGEGAPTLSQRVQALVDDRFFEAPSAQGVIRRLDALVSEGKANFSQVARARQALNALQRDAANARNGSLTEATRAIRQELDDWTRETMQASQAVDAAESLRNANTLFSEYKQLYGSQGRTDLGGQALERMLDVETTGQQVADAILGQGNAPRRETLQTVQRVMKIATGTTQEGRIAQRPGATAGSKAFNSETGRPATEVQALREATLHRILAPTVKRQPGGSVLAQTLRTNLREALDGSGKEITEILFTPPERAAMRRYLAIVERLVPPAGTVNTSNTAYEISRMLQGATDGLFRTLFGTIPALVFRAPVQTFQGQFGEAMGKIAAQRAISRPIVNITLGPTQGASVGATAANAVVEPGRKAPGER